MYREDGHTDAIIVKSTVGEIVSKIKEGQERSLALSALQKGDIIATTTAALESGLIRGATWSDYSHVMLYVGDNRTIEAVAGGVVERDISESTKGVTLAVVYRNPSLTSIQADQIIEYARAQIGVPFDYFGAPDAILPETLPFEKEGGAVYPDYRQTDTLYDAKLFCSELISRSYFYADAPLRNVGSAGTNPSELISSPKLEYQGHIVYSENEKSDDEQHFPPVIPSGWLVSIEDETSESQQAEEQYVLLDSYELDDIEQWLRTPRSDTNEPNTIVDQTYEEHFEQPIELDVDGPFVFFEEYNSMNEIVSFFEEIDTGLDAERGSDSFHPNDFNESLAATEDIGVMTQELWKDLVHEALSESLEHDSSDHDDGVHI